MFAAEGQTFDQMVLILKRHLSTKKLSQLPSLEASPEARKRRAAMSMFLSSQTTLMAPSPPYQTQAKRYLQSFTAGSRHLSFQSLNSNQKAGVSLHARFWTAIP